jgi:adenylate cyclase
MTMTSKWAIASASHHTPAKKECDVVTQTRAVSTTHTFVFADLAGYTALTEAHGDEEAAEAAAGFHDALRSLLPEHDAEEVKAIGDALLVRVTDAAKAAGLAERIVCDYGTRHRALAVRVGMHTGTAVNRGGDWFGSAVNIASRVADLAGAGEVLCTEATRRAVGPAVPLRERGSAAFKNLVEPIAIYEFVLTSRAGPDLPLDPVCLMGVDSERAVERREHGGVEYHFCSRRCAEAFDDCPEVYVTRVP